MTRKVLKPKIGVEVDEFAKRLARGDRPPDTKSQSPSEKPRLDEPVLQASQLFGDRREVWIEHNGERYRLRITRRGKLILQK